MARLLGIALVTLAFAACGDDADDSAGGGSQVSTTDQAQTAPEGSGTTPTTEAEDDLPTSSGDDEQGSDSEPPSLAEYVRRADPICRSAQADIARNSAEYRDLTNELAQGKIKRQDYVRRAGDLIEGSAEIAQEAVVDLKELPLPTSRQDAIKAYLQGATTQSEILAAQGRALREEDTEEIAELNSRITQANQENRSAAQRVGFRVCGVG
jgi:hypothetical protein